MKILLVGSGGREHALALGLKADKACTELHVAPGNPGIASVATLHPLVITDNAAICELAKKLSVDLVVIGPEVPLVNGAADVLRAAGFPVFGPSKAAAQLEGSKDFAKKVMSDAGVPTARSFTCTKQDEIEKALDAFGAPYVVKDDGLAAGKGVVVTNDRQVALEHALKCTRVVIEEYLAGPEISLFGISDGRNILPMEPAQDFKRAHNGDEGPNTGGMGAYSPLPWAPTEIVEETYEKVLAPMIAEMAARGTPFVGLLYAGLALTDHGIRVIEFNARFGDPETQVLIPRLVLHLQRCSTRQQLIHSMMKFCNGARKVLSQLFLLHRGIQNHQRWVALSQHYQQSIKLRFFMQVHHRVQMLYFLLVAESLQSPELAQI